MALKSAVPATLVAERISKLYPCNRVVQFAPVSSVFSRDGASADTYGDLELDELEDEEDEEAAPPPTPAGPDETFWALREVSFQVRPGAALGVHGGPGSGKSTLMRILAGVSFPTEGRVLVQGRVSPLAGALARVLKSKGSTGLTDACALLGIESRLVEPYIDEIEDLVRTDDDTARRMQLAVAAAVVLPAAVILLDELPRADPAFGERIVERVRERLRSGSSLVVASRRSGVLARLCDETILLHEGSISEAGVPPGQEAVPDTGGEGAKAGRTRFVVNGRRLRLPPVVTPFNAWAALLDASVRTAAVDGLWATIRLETAVPDIEARCGLTFKPADGDAGIRLELPQPNTFAEPGTYLLTVRAVPGTLPSGLYDVRADAILSNPAQRRATVIARDLGRIGVAGDELDTVVPDGSPVPQWDGSASWPAEAEWSIET